MKTELMLLLQTDGRPTMNLKEVAELLNIQTNSLLNRIYAKRLPFAMFQLDGGRDWYAHVSDVAAYIDEQRRAASADLAENGTASPARSPIGDRPHARAGAARGRSRADKDPA